MKDFAIVIAAGKGTRMKSQRTDVSKVAFPLLGRPMLQWVLEAVKGSGVEHIVTVAGFGGKRSEEIAAPYGEVVWQEEQKGTGHAVLMAKKCLCDEDGVTLVCCGDTPLLTDKTLAALVSSQKTHHNAVTVLTAFVDNPQGHGRIQKDGVVITAITEQKDCGPDLAAIHEINAGVYAFDNRILFRLLSECESENAKEIHLSDLVRRLIQNGEKVVSFLVSDPSEASSVNDRYELSLAAKALQRRINKKWMIQGVSFEDPDTAYCGPDVTLGRDTVICPNTYIYGPSVIGVDNIIGPGTYLDHVTIGARNKIAFCHLCDTVIDDDTDLGPYLRTRKGVHIRSKAHIGNFNELKNVDFGEGAKCAHLSYLGDSNIGEAVNVGCGTIIANYDGVNKFRSEIGDHAFIGSGTTIISPVHVGSYAFTAAGSTIHRDVPAHDLGIARARQENKEGYADVLHEKALQKKKNK